MDAGRIHELLAAAGLPVLRVVITAAGEAPAVEYTRALTVGEQATAVAVLSPVETGPRRPRKLRAIVADLDALSGAQKSAIWTHLSGGSPPRWTLSDDGTVWACLRTAARVADPLQTELRLLAVAKYVRDENPVYLVSPSWAPTIDVPGDEPVT